MELDKWIKSKRKEFEKRDFILSKRMWLTFSEWEQAKRLRELDWLDTYTAELVEKVRADLQAEQTQKKENFAVTLELIKKHLP